jgi:hypothetical protein
MNEFEYFAETYKDVLLVCRNKNISDEYEQLFKGFVDKLSDWDLNHLKQIEFDVRAGTAMMGFIEDNSRSVLASTQLYDLDNFVISSAQPYHWEDQNFATDYLQEGLADDNIRQYWMVLNYRSKNPDYKKNPVHDIVSKIDVVMSKDKPKKSTKKSIWGEPVPSIWGNPPDSIWEKLPGDKPKLSVWGTSGSKTSVWDEVGK